MSNFDDLLQDVIHAAGNVVSAYEWGTGVAGAQKELKEAIAAIKAEYERKGAWAKAWKKAVKWHRNRHYSYKRKWRGD